MRRLPHAPKEAPVCLDGQCDTHQWPDYFESEDCVDCAYADACDGTPDCAENHEGYACGACKSEPDKRYFLLNGRCRECPDWANYAWLIALIFAAFFCLCIYRATGLDTGCCYGKKLTAIVLSEGVDRSFVEVAAREVYEVPRGTAPQ